MGNRKGREKDGQDGAEDRGREVTWGPWAVPVGVPLAVPAGVPLGVPMRVPLGVP